MTGVWRSGQNYPMYAGQENGDDVIPGAAHGASVCLVYDYLISRCGLILHLFILLFLAVLYQQQVAWDHPASLSLPLPYISSSLQSFLTFLPPLNVQA